MGCCPVCDRELEEPIPDFCPEALCGWETVEDLQLGSFLNPPTDQEIARYQERLQKAKKRWEAVQQMAARATDKKEQQPVKGRMRDDQARRREMEDASQRDAKGLVSKAGDRAHHIANGIGIHMRLAPAATFPMGVNDSGTATVETPFWIAETQVTYALWYSVRKWGEDNGFRFANKGREGSGGPRGVSPTLRGGLHPVTEVNWNDCIVWCNALSEMLGCEPVYTSGNLILRTGWDREALYKTVAKDTGGFRLTTSKEWELAARYKDGSSWTPGDHSSGAWNKDAHEEVAWYGGNASGSKPVGRKKANGLGLYDMSGNVGEWCFDWHPNCIGSRVVRGGGDGSDDDDCFIQIGRVDSFGSDYIWKGRDDYSNGCGLRLVKTHSLCLA